MRTSFLFLSLVVWNFSVHISKCSAVLTTSVLSDAFGSFHSLTLLAVPRDADCVCTSKASYTEDSQPL